MSAIDCLPTVVRHRVIMWSVWLSCSLDGNVDVAISNAFRRGQHDRGFACIERLSAVRITSLCDTFWFSLSVTGSARYVALSRTTASGMWWQQRWEQQAVWLMSSVVQWLLGEWKDPDITERTVHTYVTLLHYCCLFPWTAAADLLNGWLLCPLCECWGYKVNRINVADALNTYFKHKLTSHAVVTFLMFVCC